MQSDREVININGIMHEEVEECAGYGDRFDKYNYTKVMRKIDSN